jgi:hypothetical protein
VVVKIDSATHNPLIKPEILSPNIDFHVTLYINFTTDPLHPTYSISGTYDAFPCTELYMNDQCILSFDTAANGKGPEALLGFGSDTVSANVQDKELSR